MNTFKFMSEFSEIERHLVSLMPSFNRENGFGGFLNSLKKNASLEIGLLNEIHDVFIIRNKIVTTPDGNFPLTTEDIEKIKKIKKALNI